MLGVCCRWRPSGSLCSISYHHLGAIYERSEEEGGCDGLPSLETQPNCVDITLKLGSAAEVACHFALSGDRLLNHTEGMTHSAGRWGEGWVRIPLWLRQAQTRVEQDFGHLAMSVIKS